MTTDVNNRRSLHWVLKIGNRNGSIDFFRDLLGMKVLRHEEFDKGCEATCNGKTMIGYGSEDKHFVLELTYNYGIGRYKYTEDFLGVTINSKSAVARIKSSNSTKFETTKSPDDGGVEQIVVRSPDGYPFFVNDVDVEAGKDPVQKVSIAVSNMHTSVSGYWHGLLGLTIFEQTSAKTLLGYGGDQAKLELVGVNHPIDHGTAQGRIAFACPSSQLRGIQELIQKANFRVLTELVTLSTPGKADVQVVILADPDGYEICFVGDEGFRELSQSDPKAEQLLNEAIKNDHSDDWFKASGKPSA